MIVRDVRYVECSGCEARLEALGCEFESEFVDRATRAGWRTIMGCDYCPACRRSAELSAGVLEPAKAGAS